MSVIGMFRQLTRESWLRLRYGLRFHTTSTTSAPIAGVRFDPKKQARYCT
jgi:hypothetical protein